MLRKLIVAVVLGTLIAAARPATQPAPAELEQQAFEMMAQGQFSKARVPLDKAFNATPPAQRSRGLVINHAILDTMQKTFVMRAVKDLSAYLIKNRGADEFATNVLGGALNIAARDSMLKRGELWQSAYTEWERRNYVLDHSRPGSRRWGTRWLSDEEYAKIKAQQEELKQAVMDQQDAVNRAAVSANSVIQQYETAANQRDSLASLLSYLQAGQGNAQITWNQLVSGQTTPTQTFAGNYAEAEVSVRRLGPEVQAAVKQYRAEVAKLQRLEGTVIRPEWPTQFNPIDPQSPEASKPPEAMIAPATKPGLIRFEPIAPPPQPPSPFDPPATRPAAGP